MQLIFRLFLDGNEQSGPMGIKAIATWLTGLAVCASCRGGMTLRAGTSRTRVVYRYYSCDSFLKKGRTACQGRSMRVEKLDHLVTEHLTNRILDPDHLSTLLCSLAEVRAERAAAVDRRLAALAREAEEADERLRRLYKLVEDGRSEVDDLLNERIADLKVTRAKAQAALERARSAKGTVGDDRPILIERFTRTMRDRLLGGPVPARKALLGSLIDRVEVDDREVRIVGRKEALEHAILATGQGSGNVHGMKQ